MERTTKCRRTRKLTWGEAEELPSGKRGQLVSGTQTAQGFLLPKVPGAVAGQGQWMLRTGALSQLRAEKHQSRDDLGATANISRDACVPSLPDSVQNDNCAFLGTTGDTGKPQGRLKLIPTSPTK